MKLGKLICAALVLSLPFGGLRAASFDILQPSVDYWGYKHSPNPGGRAAASVFGGVGETDAEDRFAQFLVRFDTSSIVAPGQGVGNYSIGSLRLSLLTTFDSAFTYDSTYDGFGTYLESGVDADAGRPVELYAAGYRNGFTAATFNESSSAFTANSRNVFAAQIGAGGALTDVSDNVKQAFEASPLAIGLLADYVSGDFVEEEVTMTFDINLTPDIAAFFQASLNAGYIELMVTSLVPSSREAASGFPSFYTKENEAHSPAYDEYVAGQLSGDITIVPEPATWILLAGGILLLGFLARRAGDA